MAKVFQKGGGVKLPQRHKEAQHGEYGDAHRGITVCERCNNVLFKKEWHHSGDKLLEQLRIAEKGVSFTLCPACRMVTDNLFEGEVLIENIPEKYESELLRLIAAYGRRAVGIDPQHRIIRTDRTKKGLRVITTENQLAVRLGKKIRDVFKKVKLHIAYSAEPAEVDQVRAVFQM